MYERYSLKPCTQVNVRLLIKGAFCYILLLILSYYCVQNMYIEKKQSFLLFYEYLDSTHD